MPINTMSSAGTSVFALDYYGAKTTTLQARFSSSTSSAAFTWPPSVTLDDIMLSSSPRWALPSTAATTTYTSSTNFDGPPTLSILSPISGARLTSTGLSSGSIIFSYLQNAGG